jgi:hypothetical protein
VSPAIRSSEQIRCLNDKPDYRVTALEFLRRVVCEGDLKSIIDRFSEVLAASDVPFGRSHRRVTEEKLNLPEFPSSTMTEPGKCDEDREARDGQRRFAWHIVSPHTRLRRL